MHYGLHFVVRVVAVAATVHWLPTNQAGSFSLQRGQVITESASFVSAAALTNAEFVRALSGAAHGVVITVLTPATPATVTPGVPTNVVFTLAAAPDARIGAYPAALYVRGSLFGGPVVGLHYGLHFTIHVVPAPATTVRWNNGVNYVSVPTVARGTVVTETATFTTSADVTNAVVAFAGVRQSAGLHLRLIPLSGAAETPVNIMANTPTTVNIVVDATGAVKSGFFNGIVFLYAQPSGSAGRRLLHYGLHFTGAIQ